MLKTKLIYNPHAGEKKHFFSGAKPQLLQEVHDLLNKYEIKFDDSPTLKLGDARRLAREAVEQGYERVIVAGGDGTVGEVASGLIGSKTVLAILPLGTFMNVAHMLSIPLDLESAVMVIKMGNVHSVDIGEVISLEDERVEGKIARESNYFLESVGIGFEADFQKFFLNFEKHRWQSFVQLLKDTRSFYNTPLQIEFDGQKKMESKAQIVMISNGPSMGANLAVAPEAKLNDHLLTITLYKISKKELLWHLLRLKMPGHKFYAAAVKDNPKIKSYTATSVKITSSSSRPVDADARIFGHTPIAVKIKPGAIKAVVGFVGLKQESAMLKKEIYISA